MFSNIKFRNFNQLIMAKATKPETSKVWYAIEQDSDVHNSEIYPYNSLEGAIECYNDNNFTGKLYAFKIVPLGEIEITRKVDYKFKNKTNGK